LQGNSPLDFNTASQMGPSFFGHCSAQRGWWSGSS